MGYWPGPNFALDDFNLRNRLKEIIRENGISTVVETGLNDGQSTLAFSQMVSKVYAIDHDPNCIACTRQRLMGGGPLVKSGDVGGEIISYGDYGVNNVTLKIGNSPDVLREIMPELPDNTLFFIDAHWDGECPTLDEIRAIPEGKGILVFHDFQVPGHENDFGWDHMIVNGVYHEMNENFIRADLLRWSLTYRIEFAKAVSGSKRGFCFVYPK